MSYKYKLLYETLDRLERGLYTSVKLDWCSDYISWLWKFRRIDHDELVHLTDRVIKLYERH